MESRLTENAPLSDEELARDAQSGDAEAFEELLLRYKPLVRSLAARYYLAGGDHDDLIQEGMIGLFKAAQAFDPALGSFAALAAQTVRHQILDCLRRDQAGKQRALNESSSLSAPASADEEGNPAGTALEVEDKSFTGPMSGIEQAEAADRLLSMIENELSERERLVILSFMDGKSEQAIASELALEPKQVKNALARGRRKIRNSLFSEN